MSIKHKQTPSQINIKLYTKGLIIFISITQYIMSGFQQKIVRQEKKPV